MRQIHKTVREYEEAIAAEYKAQGFAVIERDGSYYAQVTFTADNGEEALEEANISVMASGLERRLS